jgi:glycerophosphoryl diester phosphodiesterase
MVSRTTIQSFDWRTLQIAQKTGIPVTLSYLTSSDSIFPNSPWTAGFDVSAYPSLPELVRQAAHSAYSAVWSPTFSTVTAELVSDAHARGLRVIPWTINETADLMRAFSLRVDGLITDYPDAAITAWKKCMGRTSPG